MILERVVRGEGRAGVRVWAPLLACLLLVLPSRGIATGTEAETSATTATAAAPGAGAVGLDQLLRLPSSFEQGANADSRAGADEAVWRSRFADSVAEVAKAQSELETAMSELEEVAETSGGYNVGPPGGSADPTSSPMNFRLRQEIRRAREAVDESERQHRALLVQADLAGIPDSWRASPEEKVERGE